MKPLFGTDGIRGEAGKFPLDAPTVSAIGYSLASHLSRTTGPPEIVIGRDTRESGDWLERALIDGATHGGGKCLSAGVITTPGVAFLTRKLDADAGVVISASHNPYQDNGIKIFSPSGEKMDDSVERVIESDIFAGVTLPSSASELEPPSPQQEADLQQQYLAFLSDQIASGLDLRGLKIVIDCANGASSSLAPVLFQRLGAETIAINANPDGRNINLNCGSLHIDSLIEQVTKEKADLGVAFDGDADRALFVDEKGNYIDGDATLWVLANYLKAHGRLKDDTVVATVMSNIGLEIAFRAAEI